MNNKQKLILLFSVVITIIFVNSCSENISYKPKRNKKPSIITVREFNGVIFSAGCTDIKFDSKRNIDGYWSPSEEDIHATEAAIQNYTVISQPEIFTRLHKYGRQYFGIVVKGRKRIYCNFFTNPTKFPSRFSMFVLVLDGGNNYFRIEYDIDSKTCLDFLPNGPA